MKTGSCFLMRIAPRVSLAATEDRVTTVLVTGYEPFSTFDLNPSALVARALDGTDVSGVSVVGRVLPVDLAAMPGVLRDLLERHAPDLALGLGLAAGITSINVERVAVNLADLSRMPDNRGLAVADAPLAADGPDAFFATVPTRRIVERLQAEGIPAALSYSAGTHLCNAALYHLLCAAHDRTPAYRAGFLHLPLLPEMAAGQPAATPSMDFDMMRRAVQLAVEVAVEVAIGPALSING